MLKYQKCYNMQKKKVVINKPSVLVPSSISYFGKLIDCHTSFLEKLFFLSIHKIRGLNTAIFQISFQLLNSTKECNLTILNYYKGLQFLQLCFCDILLVIPMIYSVQSPAQEYSFPIMTLFLRRENNMFQDEPFLIEFI